MMNGLLLLNKDLGLSSNRAMQQVKRLFSLKKIGHTGSLDPLASGMLPLCFGEATKFAQYLLDADKSYEVSGVLGVQTTTGDVEGQIVTSKPVPRLSIQELDGLLNKFRGEILQIPPMYSALKHMGQPLYKYALQGISIPRNGRAVRISSLRLLSLRDNVFTIRVSCSKGTYMRTLVDDIGSLIGCGAHVVKLHRLTTSGFSSDQMNAFHELESMPASERLALVLPMDVMVSNFERLNLDLQISQRLLQGQVISGLSLRPATYRVYNHEAVFFGLAEYIEEKGLIAKRLCAY